MRQLYNGGSGSLSSADVELRQIDSPKDGLAPSTVDVSRQEAESKLRLEEETARDLLAEQDFAAAEAEAVAAADAAEAAEAEAAAKAAGVAKATEAARAAEAAKDTEDANATQAAEATATANITGGAESEVKVTNRVEGTGIGRGRVTPPVAPVKEAVPAKNCCCTIM